LRITSQKCDFAFSFRNTTFQTEISDAGKLAREILTINGTFAVPTNNQSRKDWKLGMEYDIFLIGFLA
jgi:hypothetical protein